MNDLTNVRENEIAVEIGAIKRQAAGTLLAASMEIGRLLCEAKELVPYGSWGAWLEEKVDYSQTTAANLMRLYREYSEQEQISFFEENRMQIFGTLTPSQAIALLPLPVEERREFVETHDMAETSVRDIEKEIAARKAAEEREMAAFKQKTELEAEINEMQNVIEDLQDRLANASEPEPVQINVIDTEEYRRGCEEAAAAAKKEAAEAAKKKLASKEAAFEKERLELKTDADKRVKELQEQLDKQKAEAASGEELERLKAEKAALESKLRKTASAGVQAFGVHFELFQKEFAALQDCLGKIEDEEIRDKLRTGLSSVLKQMEV